MVECSYPTKVEHAGAVLRAIAIVPAGFGSVDPGGVGCAVVVGSTDITAEEGLGVEVEGQWGGDDAGHGD